MSAEIDALLQLAKHAERLEMLPRTGWIFGGIVAPESVAAHAYNTTVIAMWLADKLNANTERVMRIALLHDIGEAVLTDLPRPTKDFIGPAAAQAEHRAVEYVLAAMPTSWLTAYQEYATAKTLEARIVKAADRIQMVIKASLYQAQSRGDVERFFAIEDNDYGIPLVSEILRSIRKMREQGDWVAADVAR